MTFKDPATQFDYPPAGVATTSAIAGGGGGGGPIGNVDSKGAYVAMVLNAAGEPTGQSVEVRSEFDKDGAFQSRTFHNPTTGAAITLAAGEDVGLVGATPGDIYIGDICYEVGGAQTSLGQLQVDAGDNVTVTFANGETATITSNQAAVAAAAGNGPTIAGTVNPAASSIVFSAPVSSIEFLNLNAIVILDELTPVPVGVSGDWTININPADTFATPNGAGSIGQLLFDPPITSLTFAHLGIAGGGTSLRGATFSAVADRAYGLRNQAGVDTYRNRTTNAVVDLTQPDTTEVSCETATTADTTIWDGKQVLGQGNFPPTDITIPNGKRVRSFNIIVRALGATGSVVATSESGQTYTLDALGNRAFSAGQSDIIDPIVSVVGTNAADSYEINYEVER